MASPNAGKGTPRRRRLGSGLQFPTGMNRSRLPGALVALALSFTAARVGAENMVVAGQFDSATEVDSWTVDGPNGVQKAMTFDSTLDAGACGASGAARLSTSGSGTYTVYYEICAGAVTAGDQYRVGLSVHYSRHQGVGGLYWGVAWFEGPDCTGAEAGSGSVGPIGIANEWQPVELTSSAPGGAVSAMVRLELDYQGSPDPLYLHVDRVFVRPIEELFDDSFEGGATCGWATTE